MKPQRPDFSLSKFPEGSTFSITLFLAVIGFALLALPFLLPDFSAPIVKNNIVSNIEPLYALDDVLHAGQFHFRASKGDTQPSPYAAFLALKSLADFSAISNLKYLEKTKTYVLSLAEDVDKDTEKIYQISQMLNTLGLLSNDRGKKYVNKFYNHLLALSEANAGFRANPLHASSISATFYAFQAIETLGKLDEFRKKQSGTYIAALNFVQATQDNETKGFKDTPQSEPSIQATYHAVRLLQGYNDTALRGLSSFLYVTQAQDGGFLQYPVESFYEYTKSVSDAVTTAQGLYVLETLRNKDLLGITPSLDFFTSADNAAHSFLQSSLTFDSVKRNDQAKHADLEATFYFLQLIKDFPTLNYGILRLIYSTLVGAGISLLLVAVLIFYSEQFGSERLIRSPLFVSPILLLVGAAGVLYYPPLAVITYLLLIFYLLTQYFEAFINDTTGLLTYLPVANAFVNTALAFFFLVVSPVIFQQLTAFYAMLPWNAIATFVVTFLACYFTGKSKFQTYVSTGYLSWIVSVLFLYSLLYGRSELGAITRVSIIRGHFPLIFVFLPYVSLILSLIFSVAGCLVFSKSK